MKRARLAVAVAIFALTVTACSETSAVPSTTPPVVTPSASAPGASQEPSAGPPEAAAIAGAVAQAVASADGVTALTNNNDPDRIGRPPGSTSAAVISDSGGDRSDPEPSVSWGAAVEVFETAEQAQARSDYIQGIIDDAPILGREYLTVSGTAVLRVSGELSPRVAAAYEAAFLAAT